MTGFIWDDVITRVAAIADQELTDRGIEIHAVQPYLGQDCKTPMMFPSRSPSVTVQSVKRFSFGAPSNSGRRQKGTTAYTLDWIYLHIQNSQDLNAREYEQAIRQNCAAIFRAIVRNDRMLGVGRVLPQLAEIDNNLADPTSGKEFLGAHIVLIVDEIYEL